MNKTELGSKTAKGGFANEKAICEKFNTWKKDKEAQQWLKIMGYNSKKLDSVKAVQVPTRIKKSEIEKFGISKEDFENLMRFKKCNCPKDYWEEIVVDKDENFNDKSTIYYHCSFFSEDFAIVEFESNKILYQKEGIWNIPVQ